MKKQILYLHGGMTFRRYREYLDYLRNREISLEGYRSWAKEYLDEKLGSEFEIIRPRMPRSENAVYKEWAIHFERHIPLLREGCVFLGFSLGAIFLAKWFSNNTFPKRVGGIFLVAPPYDNSMSDEDLTNGFAFQGKEATLRSQCENVHFFFSENDDCVPVGHSEKFLRKFPGAKFHIYSEKNGHFQVGEFPEIIQEIKRCAGR